MIGDGFQPGAFQYNAFQQTFFVVATGAVASTAAGSFSQSKSKSITLVGISGVGAVHAPTLLFTYFANPVGVSATGAVHAPSAKDAHTVVGVSGTGAVHAPAINPQTMVNITGISGTGTVHAVSDIYSSAAKPSSIGASGAAGSIIYYDVTGNMFGVSGVWHTEPFYFAGSPWSAYALGVGGVATVGRLSSIPTGDHGILGVSASGAVGVTKQGFTLPGQVVSGRVSSLKANPEPTIHGLSASGATHNFIYHAPRPTPVGISASGGLGLLTQFFISRQLNGITGFAATGFAWNSIPTQVRGVSATGHAGPAWTYFFGNSPMVTNNPLQLQITSIPIGNTIAPTDGALVVHSVLANAPIWWNGAQWVLLFSNPGQTVLPGFIYHLHPSNISGTSTTASVLVTAGVATDVANVSLLSLITSQTWAVSNGNAINGYDGGTTLPADETIFFFICVGITGTGIFASTLSAPTFPAGYSSAYRRIFSINTDGTGALIPYAYVLGQGGAMIAFLTTVVQDVINAAPGVSSRTLYATSVPKGNTNHWLGSIAENNDTGFFIVTGPAETDIAPSLSTSLYDAVSETSDDAYVFTNHPIITDVYGQIGIRANTTLSIDVTTRGWIDPREI